MKLLHNTDLLMCPSSHFLWHKPSSHVSGKHFTPNLQPNKAPATAPFVSASPACTNTTIQRSSCISGKYETLSVPIYMSCHHKSYFSMGLFLGEQKLSSLNFVLAQLHFDQRNSLASITKIDCPVSHHNLSLLPSDCETLILVMLDLAETYFTSMTRSVKASLKSVCLKAQKPAPRHLYV